MLRAGVGSSIRPPSRVPVYTGKVIDPNRAPVTNLDNINSIIYSDTSKQIELLLASGKVIRLPTEFQPQGQIISMMIQPNFDVLVKYRDAPDQNIGQLTGLEAAINTILQNVEIGEESVREIAQAEANQAIRRAFDGDPLNDDLEIPNLVLLFENGLI